VLKPKKQLIVYGMFLNLDFEKEGEKYGFEKSLKRNS